MGAWQVVFFRLCLLTVSQSGVSSFISTVRRVFGAACSSCNSLNIVLVSGRVPAEWDVCRLFWGLAGRFFSSVFAHGLSEWCVVIHFHWGMCLWGCMLVQQPHGCTPCLWEGIPSVLGGVSRLFSVLIGGFLCFSFRRSFKITSSEDSKLIVAVCAA